LRPWRKDNGASTAPKHRTLPSNEGRVTHAQREAQKSYSNQLARSASSSGSGGAKDTDQGQHVGERQREEGTRFLGTRRRTMVGGRRGKSRPLRQFEREDSGPSGHSAALPNQPADSYENEQRGELLYELPTEPCQSRAECRGISRSELAMDRIRSRPNALSKRP